MAKDEFFSRRRKNPVYIRWVGGRFEALALDLVLHQVTSNLQAVVDELNGKVHIEVAEDEEPVKVIVRKATFAGMMREAKRKKNSSIIRIVCLKDSTILLLRVYDNAGMTIEVFKVISALHTDGVPKKRLIEEWSRREYALNDKAMTEAIERLTSQRVK